MAFDKEKARKEREQKLQATIDKLEQGLQDIFTSEDYKAYLKTLSKFHNYSVNNTILIAMQNPEASLVAGYQDWKKKFDRQVMKGETGITILMPLVISNDKEKPVVDALTGNPVLDEKGKPRTVKYKKGEVIGFKTGTVFDISQTDGKPIKEFEVLNVDELTGKVDGFEKTIEALRETAPVPIEYRDIESGAKGFYGSIEKVIALQKGMSEAQTLKTAIHEVAHSMLHDFDVKRLTTLTKEELERLGTRKSREVEAESIAFTVCEHLGLDTSDYSFKYVAGWSSGKEMPELKKSMELIRNTAHTIIDNLDSVLALEKETEKPLEKPKMQTLKEIKDKLLPLCERLMSANPYKGDGLATYRMTKKRLEKMLDVLPDNDNGYKELLTEAIQCDSMEEMKGKMKIIQEAIDKENQIEGTYSDKPAGLSGTSIAAVPLDVSPTVTILTSHHKNINTNDEYSLLQADAVFRRENELLQTSTDNNKISPVDFKIDCILEGVPRSYCGTIMLGDKHTTGLIEHVEGFNRQELDYINQKLDLFPKTYGSDKDFMNLAENAMWKHEVFVPYLQTHFNLDGQEMRITESMSQFVDFNSVIDFPSYHQAQLDYIRECRSLLNSRAVQEMFEFPEPPEPDNFTTQSFREYQDKVRAEIAAEATERGVSVDAYVNRDNNALLSVELDTEENYNNIDGVRNSIKPEKDEAKGGKPSLMESLKSNKELVASQDSQAVKPDSPKKDKGVEIGD